MAFILTAFWLRWSHALRRMKLASIQHEPVSAPATGPRAIQEQNERNRRRQSEVASTRASWIRRNKYYYECLIRLLRHLVEPGKRVLNIWCQTGFLLDALQPGSGRRRRNQPGDG
jgi:hypothetical protein